MNEDAIPRDMDGEHWHERKTVVPPPPDPNAPTLRDHFAMAALSGLLASDDGAAWWKHAANAYELADAMLAARKEGDRG